MRHKGRIIPGINIIILTALLLTPVWARSPVNHSAFGSLLKAHVKNGLVDYQGFKADEAALDVYLAYLANISPIDLDRSEQMAFYINAYNAWTIKLILMHYPGVESIKDLGTLFKSPWKKKFVRLDGELVTLDHIEHDILRPKFHDPRIHFAINCASKSCPPLLSEPFTGSRLDGQLDGAARRFINDPHSNYQKGDTLYVSRIFKWFAEDFDHDILGFFRSYAVGKLAAQIADAGNPIKIKYLDYDWSLNGA